MIPPLLPIPAYEKSMCQNCLRLDISIQRNIIYLNCLAVLSKLTQNICLSYMQPQWFTPVDRFWQPKNNSPLLTIHCAILLGYNTLNTSIKAHWGRPFMKCPYLRGLVYSKKYFGTLQRGLLRGSVLLSGVVVKPYRAIGLWFYSLHNPSTWL